MDDLVSLGQQIPVVVATFLFCGWLIQLILKLVLGMAVDKIIGVFTSLHEKQASQLERLIDATQEHLRGHPRQ